MMPARLYRTLPLLGSRPVRPWPEGWSNPASSCAGPFHPYQPSDWGALQRYARARIVWLLPLVMPSCVTGSTNTVLVRWP